MVIKLHNEAGQLVASSLVSRCRVSKYDLSTLAADATTTTIEGIGLANDGSGRDVSG